MYNVFFLDKYQVDFLNKSFKYESLESFNQFIESCNKVKLCLKKELFHKNRLRSFDVCENNVNCQIYSDEIIEFIFVVIFQPIIDVIGIFTNIMIVIIIDSKRNKETFFKKYSFFKYIIYISKLNILNLVLNLTSLMNYCIEYDGIFCSTIRNEYFVQYSFIIYNFLDGLFTFCSNFLLTIFSINRFLSIDSNFSNFSNKIIHASSKKIFITIFICGCLIKFAKIFEYKINDQVYYSIFKVYGYDYQLRNLVQIGNLLNL